MLSKELEPHFHLSCHWENGYSITVKLEDISEEAASIICSYLKKYTHIKFLKLESKSISYTGALAIFTAITTLNSLCCCIDNIPYEAVISLAEALKTNTNLKTLEIQYSDFEKIKQAFITSLKENFTLQNLYGLTDDQEISDLLERNKKYQNILLEASQYKFPKKAPVKYCRISSRISSTISSIIDSEESMMCKKSRKKNDTRTQNTQIQHKSSEGNFNNENSINNISVFGSEKNISYLINVDLKSQSQFLELINILREDGNEIPGTELQDDTGSTTEMILNIQSRSCNYKNFETSTLNRFSQFASEFLYQNKFKEFRSRINFDLNVIENLKYATRIEALILSMEEIPNRAILDITQALQSCINLKTFIIFSDVGNNGTDSLQSIFDVLKTNTSLTTLHLYITGLSNIALTSIAEVLAINSTLRDLHIMCNPSEEVKKAFADNLEKNFTIMDLNSDISNEQTIDLLKQNTMINNLKSCTPGDLKKLYCDVDERACNNETTNNKKTEIKQQIARLLVNNCIIMFDSVNVGTYLNRLPAEIFEQIAVYYATNGLKNIQNTLIGEEKVENSFPKASQEHLDKSTVEPKTSRFADNIFAATISFKYSEKASILYQSIKNMIDKNTPVREFI